MFSFRWKSIRNSNRRHETWRSRQHYCWHSLPGDCWRRALPVMLQIESLLLRRTVLFTFSCREFSINAVCLLLFLLPIDNVCPLVFLVRITNVYCILQHAHTPVCAGNREDTTVESFLRITLCHIDT